MECPKRWIAVIDDGINQKPYQLPGLVADVEVTGDLQVRRREAYNPYELSHGTNCGAIIHKFAPDAPLCSVKILNDQGLANVDQLLTALTWCAETGISLIHLSLGTINPQEFASLRSLINKLARAGCMIVAAGNNLGRYTYPAALANVIGVRSESAGDLAEGEYLYHDGPLDGIELTAVGQYQLTDYRGHDHSVGPSNSYAAPYITALVYRIIQATPDVTVDQVKGELRKGAKWGVPFSAMHYRRIDWMERGVLLTFDQKQDADRESLNGKDQIGFIDIIHFEGTELIPQLDAYLLRNPWVDTVILDEQLLLGAGQLEELVLYLENWGKSLVYLNEEIPFAELGLETKFSQKLWYPKQPMENQLKGETESVVPYVAIIDQTGGELHQVLTGLSEYFTLDLYNPRVVTNSSWGVFCGFEYLPCSLTSEGWRGSLQEIEHLFDPGIVLLGIDEPECLQLIHQTLELDIVIYVVDQPNELDGWLRENLDYKRIVFAKGDQVGLPGVVHFPFPGEGSIEELYRYIIQLYQEEI